MSLELLTVSGTLDVAARDAVIGGAVATVKLVDGEGEVLAASAIETADLPATFALVADPTFTADPGSLFVWAALRSADGVWGTTELVEVGDGTAAVLLTKIDED